MDPWLILLSELNAPKMLQEEEGWWRRGGEGEEREPQIYKKRRRQFSLPTGQCQLRDNTLALIAPSPAAEDNSWEHLNQAPPDSD